MEVLRSVMRSIRVPSMIILNSQQSNSAFQTGGLLQRLLPVFQTEFTSIRTNIRKHFKRPNEYKRLKKHGFHARMATPGGRKILMRRILKGRHILCH